MDCGLPGSAVHEIFQARILYWLPFPTPGYLLHPGIKSTSSALQQAESLPLSHKRKKEHWNQHPHTYISHTEYNICTHFSTFSSVLGVSTFIYLFASLCLLIYLFIKSVTDLIGDILLKEINPEYSLEGLMLKLKLQFFGHLMQRVTSLEKTLMLGKIEGRRRRGRQRM